MRISQNGDVDIGQTGGGVKLAVAGAVGPQNGTAAAPTHTFYSDTDTGMYRSGANALGFSTGGSNAMSIDSSQRVLINTSTSRVVGGSAQAVTQIYNTSNGALLSLFRDQASNNGGAIIRGGKARNGAIVQDNDTIFSLEAVAHDGTDMGSFAGTIAFLVDGTPGANDTPSRIAFYTTADGSASGSERMRISNDGTVSIGIGASHPSILRLRDTIDTSANTATGVLTLQGGASTYSSFLGMDATGLSIGLTSSSRNLRFVTNSATAMTIDTSQRVLIGHTGSAQLGAIQHKLQVFSNTAAGASISRYSNTAGGPFFTLHHTRSTTAGGFTLLSNGDQMGTIQFAGSDGTDNIPVSASISSSIDNTPGANDMPGRLVFATTADGATSTTEHMRIASDGDVLIGTTNSNLYQASAGSTADNGFVYGVNDFGTFSRYANDPLILNRTGTDGGILQLRKNGTTVGSIGVYSNRINIGQGDVGIFFDNLTDDAIKPWNISTNAARDAAIDLGENDNRFKDLYLSGGIENTAGNLLIKVPNNTGNAINFQFGNVNNNGTRQVQFYKDTIQPAVADDAQISLGTYLNRFKDAYLSGGVYLGGTAAANKLDDYEEGTWTPSLAGATGETYSAQHGYYTKIGNHVTCQFYMAISGAPTGGSNVNIVLPFAPQGTVTSIHGGRLLRADALTVSNDGDYHISPYNGSTAGFIYNVNGTVLNYTSAFGTGVISASFVYTT
jgi:hypothetical protein